MTYSLNTIVLEPLSKNKPKNAVILCHGYGGDGNDISILANYWRAHLPDTIFICPDAPEKCAASPSGFQWFDLMDQTPEQVLAKSLVAEKKLILFLEEVLDNFKLQPKNLALAGFSQGCMMSIQVALKNKKQLNCVVGYSGKVINQKHLSNNIYSKPKLFLMHGANDTIVSPTHLLEAKEYLTRHGIKTKTKLFQGCEHHIPTEGSSLGLGFLRKNLL